jgi:hypothetical protein
MCGRALPANRAAGLAALRSRGGGGARGRGMRDSGHEGAAGTLAVAWLEIVYVGAIQQEDVQT